MKTNKNLLFTLWSAAIILCAGLSIFVLLFAACSKDAGSGKPVKDDDDDDFTVETMQPEPDDEPESTDEPQTPAPAATVRLGETADAGREYLDQIIFLGDSTTYGIGAYYGYGYTDLCPPTQVWTPANGTLTLSYYNVATVVYPETGEELAIADAVEKAKPRIMVLTLGVNGIAFMDEEWFIRDYTALVEMIKTASPDTRLILNSIYPVAASYQYQKDINNDKIRAANGWIETIAANTGCRFLNSFEALVGDNGYLPEDRQNGDGLHLTGEAFGIVMNYIRTHAYN